MHVFQIDDMTCKHCESSVTKAVKEVDTQAEIAIDLNAHTATIHSAKEVSLFEKAILEAGFTPTRQA